LRTFRGKPSFSNPPTSGRNRPIKPKVVGIDVDTRAMGHPFLDSYFAGPAWIPGRESFRRLSGNGYRFIGKTNPDDHGLHSPRYRLTEARIAANRANAKKAARPPGAMNTEKIALRRPHPVAGKENRGSCRAKMQ
jgi:hypothetical protein